MDHPAAGVDHVRHVARTLLLGGNEQRLAGLADHPRRIIPIEQRGTDAVLPHGSDPVRQEQPARFGLQR